MTSLAERFAEFAADLEVETIPDKVVAQVRLHLLDTLAAMCASDIAGSGTYGRDVAAATGGTLESTVIGLSRRVPAASAALANGVMAGGLDFDDTHSPSMTHPSGVLFATGLAVGEAVGATYKELLAAVVAGCEMTIRIGSAAPGEFIKNNHHTNGIAGSLGAALTASVLLKLAPHQAVSAVGISGSQASGILEFLADGSDAMQIQTGWAAHSGVVAALFAQRGVSGPRTVIEGEKGVFRTFLRAGLQPDYSVMDDLGTRWCAAEPTAKLYPACQLNHPAIDAVRSLLTEDRFDATDIDSVVCVIPDYYLDMVEPREQKWRPRSSYEARFSLPYCTAVAIRTGTVQIDAFTDDALGDVQTRELARRISYEVAEFEEFPSCFPTDVVIRLSDGRELVAKQRANRTAGEPEIVEKFRHSTGSILAEATAQRVIDQVLDGPNELPVGELMKPFRTDDRLDRRAG